MMRALQRTSFVDGILDGVCFEGNALCRIQRAGLMQGHESRVLLLSNRATASSSMGRPAGPAGPQR